MDELIRLLLEGGASWKDASGLGMVIIVIIKLIHDLTRTLRTRGVSFSNNRIDLKELKERIDTLYVWHNEEDADGVKVWYNRKSVEDKLGHVHDLMLQQQKLLEYCVNRFVGHTHCVLGDPEE